LRARFGRRKHRGPMTKTGPSKLAVGALMHGRSFRIKVADIGAFVTTK